MYPIMKKSMVPRLSGIILRQDMGRALVMAWVALANDLPTRLSEAENALFKMLGDFMTRQLVQI